MNYSATLMLDNNEYSDFRGYCNDFGLGKFEGDLGTQTIAHDAFEHFFEFSKFFRTIELSHAGECVAMGIRTYLDEHSCIVRKFMGYNKYQGVEWNSWNTCIGQISECFNYGCDNYTLDFNYLTLRGYKPKNIFEGYCKDYKSELNSKINEQIELAVSYGYFLGEKIFNNRLDQVYDFLSLLNEDLNKLPISKNREHYELLDEELLEILPEKFTVKVGKHITTKFITKIRV